MIQIIGLDIGRSHLKAYTECDGVNKEITFQSVVGEGRSNKVEYNNYKNPIHLTIDGIEYFIGELAEKESYSPMRNSSDDKTTLTASILLQAALEQLAVKDKVSINLGVPYRSYTASNLKKIKDTYENKRFTIKNNLTNTMKSVLIESINIMRESDSALMSAINLVPNENKPIGMVNLGFRTLEYSYFSKGFLYNDALSGTEEFGATNMLKSIQDRLMSNGITKTLNEIDSSDEYVEMKQIAYKLGAEKIKQIVSEKWINTSEMDIYVSGGVSLNLDMGDDFIKVDNPQMATAKGLYLVGNLK